MLNPALLVNTQTEQLTTKPNELTRSDESNQPKDDQFNNVLEREVTDRKSKSASKNTTDTTDKTSEQSTTSAPSETKNTANTDKTDNADNTDNTHANYTSEPQNPTENNVAPATKQISTVIPITFAENDAHAEITAPSVQTVLTAILTPDQPEAPIQNTVSGQNQSPTSTLFSSQSNSQHDSTQNKQVNSGQWQSLLTTDTENSGKTLPFTAETKQNMLPSKAQHTQAANITGHGKIQPFSAGVEQNTLDNGLWQSLQTRNIADNNAIHTFSANMDKNTFSNKLVESSTPFQIESSTAQQPALSTLQTLTQQTSQTTAPQSVNLDVQIGQPKWNGEFAQKIVLLANQQHQVAEIRLNPAHLGPVEVMLSLTQDNGTLASAQFISPHLAVREAIESALPKLRELMAENGIQLGDVSVGAESFQQQEQSEQRPHHLANETNGADALGIHGRSDTDLDNKTIVLNKHNGIVNTFA